MTLSLTVASEPIVIMYHYLFIASTGGDSITESNGPVWYG
jgi:hypothetical protein